jgi:acyl carrier protein
MADKANTIDKVKDIIAKQLSVKPEEIKNDSNIAEELGADSLDLVEILMSLEDEFGISIPDEAIPQIKTINDVVAFIEKK